MAVPDIVTGITTSPKSGQVFLSWEIPNDNGEPISDYKTEYKIATDITWIEWVNGVSPVTQATVTGLDNDIGYTFRISAINNSGQGPISSTQFATPVSGSFTEVANVLLILKDHGADVDLSSAWTVIEFEDGVPQSIKVTLSAAFGEFLTRGAKIKKFDRLYLQVTDVRGNVLKDVFHVRKLKRPRKGGKGKKLILTCPHQSEHLWKRNISLLSRRISGNEAVQQIITQLNDPLNVGTNDPLVNTNTTFDVITKKGIALDTGTSNDYIFEKKKLQEVFDKIADIEAQPPEGGGSFEPTYSRFKSDYDHTTGLLLDQVSIQVYPQGFVNNLSESPTFNNIPNITLKHGITSDDTTNTLENDSDEEPELATNLHLVCGQRAGDLLGDFSKYFGAKQTFQNARTWNPTDTFKKGSLVNFEGITYEGTATSTNQQPPNASFWIVRTFTRPDDWSNVVSYAENALVVFQKIAYKKLVGGGDPVEPGTDTTVWRRVSFVPSTDYSTQTKQKAQYWINALGGSKYAADVSKHNQCAMIDPTVVVKDTLHPRTMVRSVGTSPAAIPSKDLVNSLIPHRYRMLVVDPSDGSELGVGAFAGNDRNGIPFAGNIVEFEDFDLDGQGEWIVFLAKQTAQDQEVYDHDEGLPWVKFPCVPVFTLGLPDRFVDPAGDCRFFVGGGAASRATNWRQGSYGIYEVPLFGQNGVFYGGGTLTVPNSPIGTKQFECAHSVKWNGVDQVEVGNKGGLSADDIDSNSAVFINSSANSAPSDEQNPFYVGFNYFPGLMPVSSNAIPFGAVAAGEIINTSTFDLDNMTRTAQGDINWFGPDSENYRPIQSWAMWFEFIDTYVGSDQLQSEGDYEIGIFLIDSRDNTRILPFTQGKNNDITPQEGKLPGEFFSGVPGASATFSATEPEPTDAFNKNEILFAGIYTRDSFDNQGRYQSGSSASIAAQLIGGKVNRFAFSTRLQMSIDAFRPTKPLYVTNADEPNALPSRNIDIVDQKKTDETNYQTAKNLILGLARLFGFQQQRFEIDVEFRGDMNQGDVVYYTDTEMIDDTTDTLPNTLKMTVDKTVYKFTKTLDGPAGATAKVSIITRLYAEEP